MAKVSARQQRVELQYPEHAISPEDLLHFIETRVFTRDWDELGLDDEDDLMALQLGIVCTPRGYPVIQGTGGLRKLKFVPPKWKIGRRGALRVCYVYFEDYGIILLVCVYNKRQKDDLKPSEKKVIRDYIRRAKQALDRRQTI